MLENLQRRIDERRTEYSGFLYYFLEHQFESNLLYEETNAKRIAQELDFGDIGEEKKNKRLLMSVIEFNFKNIYTKIYFKRFE